MKMKYSRNAEDYDPEHKDDNVSNINEDDDENDVEAPISFIDIRLLYP